MARYHNNRVELDSLTLTQLGYSPVHWFTKMGPCCISSNEIPPCQLPDESQEVWSYEGPQQGGRHKVNILC